MKHNFSLEKQRRVSFCQEKQTGGSGCWAADPRHSPTPESVPARAEERSEVHLQWHRNPNPLIPGEGNGSSSRSDQIRTCSDPQSGLMKWRDFFFVRQWSYASGRVLNLWHWLTAVQTEQSLKKALRHLALRQKSVEMSMSITCFTGLSGWSFCTSHWCGPYICSFV